MKAESSRQSYKLGWLFAICFLGTAFAGTISTLMSVYLPVAVKDLLGDQSEESLNTISAYINSIFIFGSAAGGFSCGWISDRFGRKSAVIVSLLFLGVFTSLTGWMPNWWLVVICRFFSGFGLGGILVNTTTIMMEEWPKKSRAIFVGILSIAIPVGIFSAGVIDYFVSSWRQAFYVGLAPLLQSILAFWSLTESTQWKNSQSVATVQDADSKELFHPSNSINLFIGSVIFGSMLIGLWAIFLWLPTWIQTLITQGDGQKERGLSMMVLGMGGLLGGVVSGWFVNGMGIRKSLLLCFLVCSILSIVLFKTNDAFNYLIYAEIGFMALFFGISQGVLSVFIPDLFPVSVRGMATGFCFNTGRILTGVAVLFVGVMVNFLGGYAHALFVFSFVFVIGLLFTLYAKPKSVSDKPETDILLNKS